MLPSGAVGEVRNGTVLMALGPVARGGDPDVPVEMAVHEMGHVLEWQHGLEPGPDGHCEEFRGLLPFWRKQVATPVR